MCHGRNPCLFYIYLCDFPTDSLKNLIAISPQIPEEDILQPDVGRALNDPESSVFPLHCGIFLRPETLQDEIAASLEELKILKDR